VSPLSDLQANPGILAPFACEFLQDKNGILHPQLPPCRTEPRPVDVTSTWAHTVSPQLV
jgi:hypothetical protein